MEKVLKFTVDSALLKELGEKLVESVHLALAELVKNAYDADATEVEVEFCNNSEGKSQIKIIDNGVGMNFESVQNFWMRIATTNKAKRNSSDVFGRHLTGAKGVGRFSCRRLGSKLTLITNGTKNQNTVGLQYNIEKTTVYFPWDEFDGSEDVTEITCIGEQNVLESGYTGTTLIIDDVADEWTTTGLNWLKRQLAVLVSNRGAKREGYTEDPGFLLFLNAPDFEGGLRDIREDLVNAGWGTLTGYINNRHQAVCELNCLGLGRKTITSSTTFPHLKNVKYRIGIMIAEREKMRDTSVISLGKLNEILPEWGGVYVRYRGFRVHPYGSDDWLNIDHDRGLRKASPKNELLVFAETLHGVDASRSLLNMLSMRSYLGDVEISNEDSGFEMKLNREGFIESEAMKELRQFVRFGIDWATIMRDYSIRQEIANIANLSRIEFEGVLKEEIDTNKAVEKALSFISEEIKSVSRNMAPQERRVIEDNFEKATDVIRKFNQTTQHELAHFRLIASTSTLLLIFSHEVKTLLGLLEQNKNSLTILAKTLNQPEKKNVLDMAANFNDLNNRLEELLELTSLVSTDKTKASLGTIALKAKLNKVKKVFELILKKYGILFTFDEVATTSY